MLARVTDHIERGRPRAASSCFTMKKDYCVGVDPVCCPLVVGADVAAGAVVPAFELAGALP